MQLNLDVTADAGAAVAALGSVGDAAGGMAAEVQRAGDTASAASVGFDGVAEGADNVASKSSQATGALGALAGGFEALGLEGVATAMGGAAIATDVMSGAGDALNLVTETQAGQFLISKGQLVLHTAATVAQTVATGATTAAQWALNAALTANPIGVVIALLVALAAGLVIAYKNSETFRDVVDKAMDVVQRAVGFVSDGIETLIGWVKDAGGPMWDAISDKAEPVFDAVKDAVELATTPIRTMIDLVRDLIGWIADIDFPDFPNLPGLPFTDSGVSSGNRSSGPYSGGPGDTSRAAVYVNVNRNGVITDPIGTAQQIKSLLERELLAVV
jgi:hypothetical protein